MEIWKDVKNYEDLYSVSNTGKVKSKYREFIGKDGNLKKYHPTLLKPDTSGTNKTKYQRVTLSKDGKTSRVQVHRLVAETYIPNPENKPFVNHIDNDGLNNEASNLEWVTHSENMLHAQRQGRLLRTQKLGAAAIAVKTKAKLLNEVHTSVGETFGMYKLVELHEYIPKHTKCVYECILCGEQVVREFKYVTRYKPNHKCKVKI